MAENFSVLGNAADWFDDKYLASEAIYDDWIGSFNYNSNEKYLGYGAMVIATAALTAGTLGKGMVDTLRLGNGIQQGTVGGYFHDALRLTGVVGPATKLFGAGLRAIPWAGRLLAVRQGVEETCVWISAVNAMRRTGQRFFVSIHDLFEKSGVMSGGIRLFGTYSTEYPALIAALQQFGIRVRQIASANVNLNNLAAWVSAEGKGIMQVSLRFRRPNGVVIEDLGGHTLLVQAKKNGMRVIDHFGTEYASMADYIQATRARMGAAVDVVIDTQFPMLFYPNSAIGRVVDAAIRAENAIEPVVAPVAASLSRVGSWMTRNITILTPVLGIPSANRVVSISGYSGRPNVTWEDFGFDSLNSRAGGRNPNPLCPTRCH